jgi:hypothetical protein
MAVTLPAFRLTTVALLLKCISPLPSAVTKFCVFPELLVMPVPLRFNVGATVIVNALAPELNMIPSTVADAMLVEIETLVVFEMSNVAMSVVPGGVPG